MQRAAHSGRSSKLGALEEEGRDRRPSAPGSTGSPRKGQGRVVKGLSFPSKLSIRARPASRGKAETRFYRGTRKNLFFWIKHRYSCRTQSVFIVLKFHSGDWEGAGGVSRKGKQRSRKADLAGADGAVLRASKAERPGSESHNPGASLNRRRGQAESLGRTRGRGDPASRDNGPLHDGCQHPLSPSSRAGFEGARLSPR